MEFKRNEATINRPEGDRVLDGSYVFSDIPSYVRQLKEEKAWEKNDRNGITIFKSSDITIVITALRQGATIMNNAVDGYLTIQVLSGSATITTPEGDIDATANQIIVFHPGIEHSFVAQSDVIVLLTTYDSE